jgi:NADH-quinone oxidoreductase subunit E
LSITEATRGEMREVIARYPRSRSAIMPMLHLVQAEEGYVSPAGIEVVAEELGLTTAEVTAVATFYSMYKRRPVGDYHVGVCTNTLCAVMGGDQIFADLKDHLGVGNDETTADGKVTLEHVECNAACDYAPVVMVNWEFMDNQTPESARALVDDLRAGKDVTSTRGPKVRSFREVSKTLAGFDDGLAGEGPSAGPASLIGLELAHERGDTAPAASAGDSTPDSVGGTQGPAPSSHDEGVGTSASDPAHDASSDGSSATKEDSE